MEIRTLPVGMLEVNCYLLWHPRTSHALILDPGDETDVILDAVRQLRLDVRGILLTHTHVDHIRGVGVVAVALGVPVWVHAADLPMYRSPLNALPPWLPAAADLPEPVAQPPQVEGLPFTVIETPGHSPGGVCFYFAGAGVLFSGDTLFQGSVGRTDLPGGDAAALQCSLARLLRELPPETRVLPGHGPETTMAAEAASNPYLT